MDDTLIDDSAVESDAPPAAEPAAAAEPSAAVAAAAAARAVTSEELEPDEQETRTHRKRGPARTKQQGGRKRQRDWTEQELEADVAFAVGLNAYGLEEDEQGIVDDVEEEMYFQVRNHILTRWRSDVSRFLTEEEAGAKIAARYRHLVPLAWRFLYRHGWINFGVAPAITSYPQPTQKASVVVVGAGLAGLSAARQLRNHGYSVVVLEAAARGGGRVHGIRLEDEAGRPAIADAGGSIITGIDGNPLAVLAAQLGLPLHNIDSTDVPLYLADGSQPDKQLDEEVHSSFDALLDRAMELRDQMGEAASASISLQSALTALLSLETSSKGAQGGTEGAAYGAGSGAAAAAEGAATGATGAGAETETAVGGRPPAAAAAAAVVAAAEAVRAQGLQGTHALPPGLDGHQAGPVAHSKPQQQQQQQQQAVLQQDVTSGSAGTSPAVATEAGNVHHQPSADASAAAAEPVPDAGGSRQIGVGPRPLWEAAQMRRMLLQWHMANIEFANAAQLNTLSMKHWDLDDPFEHPGAHVFLPGSNLRLVEALAADLPIFYKAPVHLVDYSGGPAAGVAVHTPAGLFKADAALVTVPLGVLKKGGVVFQPPLPARKLGAIKRLGFGLLNKVMLRFPHCFWGTGDMFGHVQQHPQQRGLFYLFYTYDGISGGAVLAGLVAGQAAEVLEQQRDGDLVQGVLRLLQDIFEPQGVQVPPPLASVVTRWGADVNTWGSYSSVCVGSKGPADYDVMAEPLAQRLFFAGEATTSKYPATMHGAFDSGLREAARIMEVLGDARDGPQRRQQQQQGAAGRLRGAGGGGGEAGRYGGGVVRKADEAAQEAGRRLLRLAEQLSVLFPSKAPAAGSPQHLQRGPEPDVEVGLLRAHYGPAGTPWAHQGLAAIDTGAVRGTGRGEHPTIYTLLPRSHIELVQDVRGGNEARLALLTGELGVKLVGQPLSREAEQLLQVVWQHKLPGMDVPEPFAQPR